jgi:hypothetical protein
VRIRDVIGWIPRAAAVLVAGFVVWHPVGAWAQRDTLYGQPIDSPDFARYTASMCLAAAARAAVHSTTSRWDSVAIGGETDTAAVARVAHACAPHTSPGAVSIEDLPAATELALLEGDDSGATALIGRRLAGAATAMARGHVLRDAVRVLLGFPLWNEPVVMPSVRPAMVAAARRSLAALDALPMADDADRLRAHLSMLHYAQLHQVGDDELPEARTVLRLVRAVPLGRAAELVSLVRAAYEGVVTADLDTGDTTAAYGLVRRGAAERPDLMGAGVPWFASLAGQDTLIGRRAPPIQATVWLDDTTGDTIRTLPTGTVTLIEFTYPFHGLPARTLQRVTTRYGGDSLRVLRLATLQGYFRWTVPLTQAEEVDSLRTYFGAQHAEHVTVALSATTHTTRPDGRVESAPTGVQRAYHTWSYPSGNLVIVDQRGVIRAIEFQPNANLEPQESTVSEYDWEERVTAVLDHLLRPSR